jgi:hypothetical protein
MLLPEDRRTGIFESIEAVDCRLACCARLDLSITVALSLSAVEFAVTEWVG